MAERHLQFARAKTEALQYLLRARFVGIAAVQLKLVFFCWP
jgi:hypothetical protein